VIKKSFGNKFHLIRAHPDGACLRELVGQGSQIAFAGAIGIVIAASPVHAEVAANTGSAARLVGSEPAVPQNQRVAQNTEDPGFAVREISGPANQPIPIRIRLPRIENGVYNFLVFQNIPDAFEMSTGFPVEDRWVVPLDDVKALTMKAPPDYRGSFSLQVKLRVGGTDKSVTLTVPVKISSPADIEQSRGATGANSSESSELSEDAEQAMLDRAEAMLATRDIASARMIYKYLVKRGSGSAAYGLAQTYDPALLDEIGIAGMDAADLELAKKWYERAALLGQEDAQERLKVIAAGTQ